MAKVHRAYRHSWWRTSRAITERDCQAMYNFHQEGIPLETIAEHFGCSIEYATEQAVHRPWLRPLRKVTDFIPSQTWLESDHSDPLELVKVYYPQFLPKHLSTEVQSKESPHVMTWEEYLETIDWNDAYDQYGESASDVVKQKAMEIAAKSNILLTFAD